ncbi:MAG: cytochrome P460 family protein [Opitutus sp.]
MKHRHLLWFTPIILLPIVLLAEETPKPAPEVPYPSGYRTWRHITSAVLPTVKPGANPQKPAAPRGLMHHVYANELALEGYRTGSFPTGAVLIADWFVLEPRGPELIQGARSSVNVMVRDPRYSATGGWGFEDFDRDTTTTRNVGSNAVKMCFECHQRIKNREFVISDLKP